MSTALVICGRQGTGKTLLGETMAEIYGANYGQVTNPQLVSQFNEWAENKQFILGNEISLGDKRHTANELKDMITSTMLRINSKNKKTYVVKDCINYCFTSNHDDAMFLEDDDRRFFVHRVETAPLTAEQYTPYWRWLREEGGAARLFHYLLNEVDLGDFDPKARAPDTIAKRDMKATGRGDTEDWCISVKVDPDSVIPQPYDLFRTTDLLGFYDPDRRERTKVVGLSRALRAAGVVQIAGGNNTAVVEGVRTRLWAVRHPEKYRLGGPAWAARMYAEERAKNPVKGTPGFVSKFEGRRVQ
jgi:hypothetical protein